ncbi:RagB/SusD family nutrient uptake outer membrane protein [Sphingobacterium suaedae]|uniref:RagB/SusD family nutrient uptake outer membrane protein n=1 Tax=Sphingobacterium suaedae TaxID=1686402 RepID=A0ABW5KK36_9SPHI
MKKIIYGLLLCCSMGCDSEFLDVKSESNLVVPNKIEDLEALMNNLLMFNGVAGELAVVGADEYTVGDGLLQSLTAPWQRNAYLWADQVYEGQPINDWNNAYQRILYCNIVLERLSTVGAVSTEQRNRVKGTALFHRAYSHYLLQNIFGKPYNPSTKEADLGIPLKLESDVTLRSKRATVAEVYGSIISDLNEALSLLPEKGLSKYAPGKDAVNALLAKVHLDIFEYTKALSHASDCLSTAGGILNYNDVPEQGNTPFPTDPDENPEIIFYASMLNATILRTRYSISEELLGLYAERDLRKKIFFTANSDGRMLFKGSYLGYGSGAYFLGLATDEIRLIEIECLVRTGDYGSARAALVGFLERRFATGAQFNTPADDGMLLSYVLEERRRQLIFRGNRWADLRRLNGEGKFRKTLKRSIDGKDYELLPNSPKYSWPIPDDAVQYSDIVQNER